MKYNDHVIFQGKHDYNPIHDAAIDLVWSLNLKLCKRDNLITIVCINHVLAMMSEWKMKLIRKDLGHLLGIM